MKISIVGAGVLGQATGIGLAKHGNEVLFHDTDDRKLAELDKDGYRVTSKISEAVCESDVVFVCVPTPTIKGHMDFSCMKNATEGIARSLGEAKGYRVVTVRSTVLPTTTRCRVVPLLERLSKVRAGKDFGVCMSPEFLRDQHGLEDFLNPSRIVIGELDKRSGDVLERLFGHFKAPIFRTDLDSAEMIKYAANCFLATKISYFNEIYMICRRLGLDSEFISNVASLDPRIGSYGIHGGKPFSGKCLPKDVEALIGFAKSKKINPKLFDAVMKVNRSIASKRDCRRQKTHRS